jgi:hypothetical protein
MSNSREEVPDVDVTHTSSAASSLNAKVRSKASKNSFSVFQSFVDARIDDALDDDGVSDAMLTVDVCRASFGRPLGDGDVE